MKTHLFFTAFLLVLNTVQAQKPDGSFIIRAAQYGETVKTSEQLAREKTIKVLKDGYFMVAYYNEADKTFIGSGGGTFTVKDGQYTEKVSFFSWDNTAVDSVYTFQYRLSPTRYQQEGMINSKSYTNYIIKEDFEKIQAKESLKNNALEGVWEIQDGSWASGKLGEGAYAGMTGIKIYAYPTILFGYYKPATKEFVAAGGGTYQYNGKILTENLEFFSLGSMSLPASINYNVQLDGNSTYRQHSTDNVTKETWKRISNQ